MFTIKFYRSFSRLVIEQADSFTILRDSDGTAEITLHRNTGIDVRRDIKDERDQVVSEYAAPCFDKAIIENAAGKTTEIIVLPPGPANASPREASR